MPTWTRMPRPGASIRSATPPARVLELIELRCAIFSGLEEDFLQEIITSLRLETVTAGDFIFYEGMLGNRMFFINRGTVWVVKAGKTIATLREVLSPGLGRIT